MYKYTLMILDLEVYETQRVIYFSYFKLQSVFLKIDISKCIRP